jgi:hypothetical protein
VWGVSVRLECLTGRQLGSRRPLATSMARSSSERSNSCMHACAQMYSIAIQTQYMYCTFAHSPPDGTAHDGGRHTGGIWGTDRLSLSRTYCNISLGFSYISAITSRVRCNNHGQGGCRTGRQGEGCHSNSTLAGILVEGRSGGVKCTVTQGQPPAVASRPNSCLQVQPAE